MFLLQILLIFGILINERTTQNTDGNGTTIDQMPVLPETTRTTIRSPRMDSTDPERMSPVRNLISDTVSNPFPERSTEYPGYDGWYNNIGRPELGAVDTPLLRRWHAAYKDGVYELAGSKRPNPLSLSEGIFKERSNSTSRTGKNALLVFFGQHIVEEILDAQRPACPPEYINIKIPKDHPYSNKSVHKYMPVLRTRYDETTGHSLNNPRQQLNEITPYLDGGLIYGTSKAWCDYLRTYANGTFDKFGMLAHSRSGKYPELNKVRLPMANPPPPLRHEKYINQHHIEEVDRFYMLGNPRGNENPFLLTFGIIWFRWHNVLAKELASLHPEWLNETVFNEARKWVIATQQSIIVYEWLPIWLGKNLSDYPGYDPSVDPQIDQFFQSAAFRFGHTLVPSGVFLRNHARDGCGLKFSNRSIRTCNNYWMPENRIQFNHPENKTEIDIEGLILGMSVQLAGGEDQEIVDDLRGNLFGPLEFSRRDLMALNIQRARDHGLPDYNTVRRIYGLDEVNETNIDVIFKLASNDTKKNFINLYQNKYNDIDLWVGGMMETENGPGELFTKIIEDQFERIRNGDRFWFENENNGLFKKESINKIKGFKFYHLLRAVTEIWENDLPKAVFNVPVEADNFHEVCKKFLKQQTCLSKSNEKIKCYAIPPAFNVRQEECSEGGTYDYFSNSQTSFFATFIGLTSFFGAFMIVISYLLFATQRKHLKVKAPPLKSLTDVGSTTNMYSAHEWLGHTVPNRPAIISLDRGKRQVQMINQLGHVTRALDLNMMRKMMIYCPHNSQYILLRIDHNYDLVLKFDSIFLRTLFLRTLETFLVEVNIEREIVSRITTKAVLKQAVTMKARQKRLEQFFRVVFSQAFNIAHSEDEILKIDSAVAVTVIYTELTLIEFAAALSMREDSEFVRKIFNLVDTDKNGFISFREFLDMLVLFLKGTAEDKLKLMFDMYDINGTGTLKRAEFLNMLRSFMDTVNADVSDDELESVVHSMMERAHIAQKKTIDLQDFQNLLGEFRDKLSYAELEFNVNAEGTNKKLTAGKSTIRSTFIGEVKKTVENLYADPNDLKSRVEGKIESNSESDTKAREFIEKNKNIVQSKQHENCMMRITKYIANKQLQIFWIFLYTAVLIGIFAERFYVYSILQNHSGLRQIMGYGVAVTRAAASAMMFTYSTILLTMCQNIITILRDTVLQFYIPFDSALEMHKYIAYWALIFTVIHIVGHGFNFYHISTQPADDLTCIFRNVYHATHELPKFHYWLYTTITGVTAILLTIFTGIVFISALPVVRQRLYGWFAFTHSMYPIFYVLMFLHGSGRLIQGPIFHYFFLGPAILFTIDKLFTATRKRIEIPIIRADLLPSEVTSLIFQKPSHFNYKSGQWVRIACPALNAKAYHPFTLSSAPHESHLSVHIRAVGPWTRNIRTKLDPTRHELKELLKIHIDGPYGESHQNWDRYNISIMVAGGIGVTPFASILKDIVYKCNQKLNLGCKKIYFMWVTRSQKQFEWMVDILRDVEKADTKKVISAHIFITQFYEKYDLRTILLYICELHFQKVSGKSLFTGLTAVTHFGRPNFAQFFLAIQRIHNDVDTIGIFSCGSPMLTRAVDRACQSLNSRDDNGTLFQHHYKSF